MTERPTGRRLVFGGGVAAALPTWAFGLAREQTGLAIGGLCVVFGFSYLIATVWFARRG